jgi:4-hydroxy-2-oxoheptanedioate aldolase
MGLLGKPDDPAVRAAIAQGIATVKRAGKAAGTLTSDRRLAREYLNQGALFVAVGVDTSILVKAAKELATEFTVASPPRPANQA